MAIGKVFWLFYGLNFINNENMILELDSFNDWI